MANSRTKNTLLNTASGIAVKIISLFAAFITRTVFIRSLGIQYAGVSGVFTDVLTMLSFVEMGIGSAIVFALYKPIAKNDEVQILKLMNAYKKIYSAIAAVILILGLTLIPFLNYLIKDVPNIVEDIRVIYIFYLLNTSLSYLLIYKQTFLTAAQKDYIVSKYKFIISIVKAAAECILLIVFRNFFVYLTFNCVITVIQNVVTAVAAEKEYPILKSKSKVSLERSEQKKLFENVKALFLYKVSGTVLNGTDSVVISSFVGTSFVGILGNYNLIANAVYTTVMQLFSATSASIGNLSATSTAEHQYKVFNKLFFLCAWIYCFCTTSLWVLLNPFISIWQGEEYLFSMAVVTVFTTEFYMKGMLSPISQFRTSNGLFVQGKYRPLIMAVINIVVSVALVQKIGVLGVLLGTVISRVSTQLWFDPYLIFKYVFKKNVWGFYLKYITYACLTSICCLVTNAVLGLMNISNPYINLFAGAALCVLIPNLVMYLLFSRTEEFKELFDLAKRIIKRKI